GSGVAEVRAHRIGEFLEPGHDVGMLGGDVLLLADVVFQVEEGELGPGLAIAGGLAVLAAGPAVQGSIRMWKVQLPFARTDCLPMPAPVKEVTLVRTLRSLLAEHQRADVETVDLVLGQWRAGEMGDGRQDVDGRRQLLADRAGRDVAGPAHDAGFALA